VLRSGSVTNGLGGSIFSVWRLPGGCEAQWGYSTTPSAFR